MLKTLSFVVVVATYLLTAEGFFFNAYRHKFATKPLGECKDCGDPLYLTPYIQEGRIIEGRNKSRVNYTAFHDVKSYSGFLTVDSARNSNTFFWYFPAENKPENASVLLWLQGGPGATSLYGLFSENGPFTYKNGSVEQRNYSWTEDNHVIYIDNPVGTGFSWTKSGYAQNETVVGNNLYSALLQFFKLFPELQKHEFYVTGESYAGKYVPAVCYTIHRENQNASQQINLKGFAIGNGLSDPLHQLYYAPYLYQLGLVDESGRKQVADLEQTGVEHIKAKRWMDAFHVFDKLLNGDLTPYRTLFFNLTGFDFYFNYLHTEDVTHSMDFVKLFDCPKVRRAIHVGNLTFHEGTEVEMHMREDMMQSVAGWVAELLSHYRGVFYNGHVTLKV